MLRIVAAAYCIWAFAMFLDVTGEVMDDTPASKLNDSPEKQGFSVSKSLSDFQSKQ